MQALELKIPPPIVFLICAAVMWGIAALLPAAVITFPGRGLLAGLLIATGITFGITGVIAFYRARTTVHPHKPEITSAIVTSGIYRISRNPMYVGLLLFLTAWALYLANCLALVMLPVFVAYITRFQILPEERALTAKFGADYVAYRQTVRRWL